MFGKILGAIAGSQVARHVRGVDGTGVGGYALKKHLETREAAKRVSQPSVMPAVLLR